MMYMRWSRIMQIFKAAEKRMENISKVACGQRGSDKYRRSMYKAYRIARKKKGAEIGTERMSNLFHLRQKIICHAKQTYCWRNPSSKFLLTAFHRLAAIDDGEIFDEVEKKEEENFKYAWRHKTGPLMILNAVEVASELLVQCCWTWTVPKNLSVR